MFSTRSIKEFGEVLGIFVDKWFLPENVKTSNHLRYKARILTSLHILFLILNLTSFVFSILFNPKINVNDFSFFIPFIWIFIFKKWGNFHLSGNLVALGLAGVLVPLVFKSGGLYSDNLLWLILCPIIVLLYSKRYMLMVWLGALVSFTAYLHRIDVNNPNLSKDQVKNLSPEYYLISYALLFSVILLVLFLFKKGEDDIIEDLEDSRETLNKQRLELVKINHQLRNLTEQLEKSNKDLEVFAFASSHDLKEPLRMIGSYTQLLQKRLKGQLTPETEEMMWYVRDGVTRMQKLIEDLLEFARAGKSRDKMAQIDMDDVLFYVNNNLRMKIEETDTQIVIPKPLPSVFGRYSEMVQLIQNLVSNSIKYCSKEVKPVIEISWVDSGNCYLFQLKDNGIGIAPENHDKVFRLFEQVNSRAQYGGSGIGLSTCKKIVENLGGKIWLTSQLGEGTVFYFTMPKTEKDFDDLLGLQTNETALSSVSAIF